MPSLRRKKVQRGCVEKMRLKPHQQDAEGPNRAAGHGGFRVNSRNILQHQRRILRPETDAITNRMLNLRLASDIRNVVQITFWIRNVEVNSRWNLAMLHRDQS